MLYLANVHPLYQQIITEIQQITQPAQRCALSSLHLSEDLTPAPPCPGARDTKTQESVGQIYTNMVTGYSTDGVGEVELWVPFSFLLACIFFLIIIGYFKVSRKVQIIQQTSRYSILSILT